MKQCKVVDFKNCVNADKKRNLTVRLLQKKRKFEFQLITVDIYLLEPYSMLFGR